MHKYVNKSIKSLKYTNIIGKNRKERAKEGKSKGKARGLRTTYRFKDPKSCSEGKFLSK